MEINWYSNKLRSTELAPSASYKLRFFWFLNKSLAVIILVRLRCWVIK
jgi:hypothetical protein